MYRQGNALDFDRVQLADIAKGSSDVFVVQRASTACSKSSIKPNIKISRNWNQNN
jgi:hypothetical protein